MSIFAKQFGLESEVEPFIGEGEAPVDAVIDTLEESSEIEEIESGEGGLEELEEGIETTADAAEQLEEVVEYLEKKQEEGGVTEGEAEAIEMATEAILKPFMGYVTIQMPATESFSAAGGRANSTSIAIETFKETIDKMWKAVKDFVLGLIKKVTDWFEANVSAGARLKKAAQAIIKKAEARDETQGSVELSAKTLKLLSTSSGFYAQGLKGEIAAVANAVGNNAAMAILEGPAETYVDALGDIDLSSPEKVNSTVEIKLDKVDVKNLFSKFGKKVSNDKRFVDENSDTYVHTPYDLGGKSQFLTVVTGDVSWFMKRVKLRYMDTKAEEKAGEPKNESALKKKEIIDIGKEVVKLADAIISSQREFKKSKETVDKLLKSGDKLSSQIGKADEKVTSMKVVKDLKVVLNGYSTLGSVLSTGQSQLVSEAKEIGYAALTFCSASLKTKKESKKG